MLMKYYFQNRKRECLLLLKNAKNELQKRVNKRRDECIESIANAFGFTEEDLSNEAPSDGDSESLVGFNVFDSSRLRWAASLTGLISVGTSGGVIDAFVGGASFGAGVLIGGLVGAIAGYCGGTAYEYTYDKSTFRIKVKTTTPVMLLLIGFGVSAARALKVRGRANPHEVKLAFNKNAFKPSKELLELVEKKGWIAGATKQQLRAEVRSAILKDSGQDS